MLVAKVKGKVKVVTVFFFNWAPRNEGVLENGGIAQPIP
jgi:hypothetical protein